MKIMNTQEGFQGFTDNCQTYQTINGKKFWLCRSDNYAAEKVNILISTGNIYDGVCYPAQRGFYTCYTRPSQKTFDSNLGIFVTGVPNDDSMPASIESDIDTVCNDYAKTWASFSTLYISTTVLGKVVDDAIDKLKAATDNLAGVSTMYCNTGRTRTAAAQHACDSLGAGIVIFKGLPNTDRGLNFMSNTIVTAVTNMDNLYNNTFTKAYAGFGYSTCSNFR